MDAGQPQKQASFPISLALSGGGLAGALFEFGAVAALEAGLPGWKAVRCALIVGTSAGAVTGAVLAWGIDPKDTAQALLGSGRHPLRFGRRDFFGIAIGKPSKLLSGAFTNAGVERFLQRAAAFAGRADRFDDLVAPLAVTATDLDGGERAVFGPSGPDLPPVSKAVRASAAIPGTFRPVRIGDRDYIDGQIADPLHLDLAMAAAPLAVFGIWALPPYRREDGGARVAALHAPAILDQTGRVSAAVKLARSRAALQASHPKVPVFLIEPDPKEVWVLLRSGFDRDSFRAAWELGYRSALRFLAKDEEAILAAVGSLGIRVDRAAAVDLARRFHYEPPQGKG